VVVISFLQEAIRNIKEIAANNFFIKY
jgi:hypothetical protein